MSKTLTAECTVQTWRVRLTVAQWNKLDRLDFLDVVQPTLIKAGVYRGSIEFNGHFGRHIFFDTAYDILQPKQALDALSELLKP